MKRKVLSVLLFYVLLLSSCDYTDVKISEAAGTFSPQPSVSIQKTEEKFEITSINLNDCSIYDVEHIDIPDSVRSLDLSQNNISDISSLVRLKNVQELNLSDNQIIDISSLAELKSLRRLTIKGNPVTDIAALKVLPQLESLELDSINLHDIRTLNELPNLKWLDIGIVNIDNLQDYKAIAAITAVNLENTNSQVSIANLQLLSEFQNLQSVSMSGFNFDNANFEWLEDISGLRKLCIPILYENISATLEKMPLLSELEIQYLEDGSPLKGFTRLEKLSLHNAKDIQFISQMRNLVSLSVTHNSDILDIGPVADLTKLEELYVESRNLSDISPVANLVNLKKLSFSWCSVNDLQALSGLTSLEYLNLSCNNISSIDVLEKLTDIKVLTLDRNRLSDISSLSALVNLEYLRLEACRTISDLSPIAGLKKLNKLRIGDNSFRDLSPLSHLENLYYLEATSVKYSDITPLSQLKNLVYLNMLNNCISDSSPLAGLENLQYLNLYENEIEYVNTLSNLNNLRHLDVSSNNINNIDFLRNMMHLQDLYLSANQIVNLAPLAGLTNLRNVDLSNNLIHDVSPLSSLISIDTINLSSNTGIHTISDLKNIIELSPIHAYDRDVSISDLPDNSNQDTNGITIPKGYDIDIKRYEVNTIVIEYPQIKGLSDKQAEKGINDLLKNETFGYVADLFHFWNDREENDIYEIMDSTTDMDIELHCSVGLNSKNILSFSYDVYGYGHGGAHPNTWGFAYTVDMESKNVIGAEDFFINKDSLLNAKIIDWRYGIFINKLKNIIGTLDEHSWYITEDGNISFFYAAQNSYAEHIFPFNQMADFITPHFYIDLVKN